MRRHRRATRSAFSTSSAFWLAELPAVATVKTCGSEQTRDRMSYARAAMQGETSFRTLPCLAPLKFAKTDCILSS